MTGFKVQKAYKLHGKGEIAEARKLYEEAISEGMNQPRYLLSYAVLLLRSGEYQKAREILVKTQKAPGITAEQRVQLFSNYAAAMFRLGEIDKGIDILEKQAIHSKSGLVYQVLGYLYTEKFDLSNKPDFDLLERENAAAQEAENEESVENTEVTEAVDASESAVPQPSAREVWEQGAAKAKAFLEEAVEYDDEDPVVLDNMGQFVYRVLGDHEGAEKWFLDALKQKENQIDTLWFLSRYDLERGNKAAAKEKLEKALGGRFSPLNYVNKEKIEAELKSL